MKMTERLRSGSCTNSANITAKMANDLTPRKTMLILVIVVGCFAVLWPKVFYPMLVGSANKHIKPSPIDKTTDIRQERPLQLRSELVHPAFRERGRAIPQPQSVTPSRPAPRIVEGRPGPIPGMRPTLGGAGHVVPPPKQGSGSMGLIMPIYTIGIVIFFTYTVMKIVFKKQPEALYPPVEPDPHFRKEVFESERSQVGPKLTRDGVSSKLGDAELDQLRRRLRETELAMERIVEQMAKVPLKLQDVVANGNVVKPQDEEQPSVKVLGMEMTASCEGGKKWSRPDSPALPSAPLPPPEPVEPPQEIFLEGALPAQSHLLVADAATEAQSATSEEDPAVVLAGKMTLSVISLDSSENGTDESSNSGSRKQEDRSSSNISEDFEKIVADIQLEDQVDDVIGEGQNISLVPKSEEFDLLQEIENDIKEINSKNIELGQLGEPIRIENIEDQIIAKHLSNDDLSLSEIAKEFIEKELFETVQQQLEKEIDENIIESAGKETRLPEVEPATVVDDESEIKELAVEEIGQPKFLQLEQEIEPDQKPPADITEISLGKEQVEELETEVASDEINAISENKNEAQAISLEKEAVVEKQLESTVAEQQIDETIQNDEIVAEVETEFDTPAAASQHEKVDSSLIVDGAVTEDLSNLADEQIISKEILTEEKSSDIKVEPTVAQDVEINKKEENEHVLESSAGKIPPVQNISAEEQETFNKLNEAIADLSSEFRRTEEEKPIERLAASDDSPIDLEEDEEEIEYEYEVSDDEGVEEDIRNIDRIDELADEQSAERLNGDDQEQSKYGTTSSATLAENEISDEDLGNDDSDEDEEEIEEIIEYITDDEEEIEEVAQPGERNNVNHVNDRSNAHE